MNLVGLDLNASRARAVQGDGPSSVRPLPRGLPLEGDERELPLAVSLEERQPRVGRAGVSVCRRSPHLACLDFLPHLGADRLWEGGRHRLDAAAALALVCEHLRRQFGRAAGVTVALPAYFRAAQVAQLSETAKRARWRLLGSVRSPVAALLAVHHRLPRLSQAVVIDLDSYALTWSAVAVQNDGVRLLHVHPVPQLGRGAWLSRLLDGVALRCIRLSRRDPRKLAETEQMLFDQLAAVLDSPRGEAPVELVLQTPHWYQHLKFSLAELSSWCAPLIQRARLEMQRFLADIADGGAVDAVLLTAPAARLPGLAASVEEAIYPTDAEPPIEEGEDDFGVSLIETNMLSRSIHILDDDAVARGAFDLALRQQCGDLPYGHLEGISLSAGDAERSDPIRLPFRGTA